MCVKTKVDYCVVASFLIQQENADSIREAMHILKDWNPIWNHDFFEAEINAVERTFQVIFIYINKHFILSYNNGTHNSVL